MLDGFLGEIVNGKEETYVYTCEVLTCHQEKTDCDPVSDAFLE